MIKAIIILRVLVALLYTALTALTIALIAIPARPDICLPHYVMATGLFYFAWIAFQWALDDDAIKILRESEPSYPDRRQLIDNIDTEDTLLDTQEENRDGT